MESAQRELVGVLLDHIHSLGLISLDPDSEFRLVVMAGVAQDEVRKLSERLKFGFRQAIKNGHVLGNDQLWGYGKKDCVLTVNETEAQAVRRIFDLHANRQMGIRRIGEDLSALRAKKDRLLEMSIEGVISMAEFKQRNDGFNQQAQALEEWLEALRAEAEKGQRTTAQLEEIRAALERELTFRDGIDSALVTTILDKIVVKKTSTKEEIHLDIHLKFGGPWEAAFDRGKSSFCFTRLRNTTPKAPTRRT